MKIFFDFTGYVTNHNVIGLTFTKCKYAYVLNIYGKVKLRPFKFLKTGGTFSENESSDSDIVIK